MNRELLGVVVSVVKDKDKCVGGANREKEERKQRWGKV